MAGASKTILVMSDSHGDRQIVEEIKTIILVRSMPSFTMVIRSWIVKIVSGTAFKWSMETVTILVVTLTSSLLNWMV